MSPAADAARRFRARLLAGDPTTVALIADRLALKPEAAARALGLVSRGRPKADTRAVELLRRLRRHPTFAPMSTAAAADAIAKFLGRYAAAGWRWESAAPTNPHSDPNDRRSVAWELGHADPRRFPPSARTVRRALATRGQK